MKASGQRMLGGKAVSSFQNGVQPQQVNLELLREDLGQRARLLTADRKSNVIHTSTLSALLCRIKVSFNRHAYVLQIPFSSPEIPSVLLCQGRGTTAHSFKMRRGLIPHTLLLLIPHTLFLALCFPPFQWEILLIYI